MTAPYVSPIPFTPEDMLGRHLPDIVVDAQKAHGEAPAFSCVLPTGHHATISYNELGEMSDAVAAFVREDLGLKRGDVIAIQAPNILSYPVVVFGILKAGVTVTNINPLYTTEETNHQLKDSGAKVWFVIDVFGDRVKQAVEGTQVSKVFRLSVVDGFPALKAALIAGVMKYIKKAVPKFSVEPDGDFASVVKKGRELMKSGVDADRYIANLVPDDVAFYQYTGGTTGRSKGARLGHGNVVANISQANLVNRDIIAERGPATMMLLLPLYHVYALAVGALSSMYAGTHIVLVPAPRPLSNLKPVFDNFPISAMPGVNTLYIGLMQEEWFRSNPPKTLDICYSGAAPLQPNTAAEWKDLTGCSIFEGYGLTESTCAVSTMPLAEEPRRGTCGRPLPGTEIRIVGEDGVDVPRGEPGELWVRGPQVMMGYLNRTEATKDTITDDGWLRTGDVATLDEDGWLAIVDRMKDMIIVSGFNVFPTDVEDVLTRSDRILDAAVVGVPCKSSGEKVCAYVVPAEGVSDLSSEEVSKHCKEHLTNYKLPRVIEIISELPKSPVGKVLRRELRDQAIKDHGESL